ncbi:MAG: recombinase family protein [Candidatus Peribacteraceae bacterium]|jgi:DNA invertase Pin-like site-specific DNA recombinase|nr:recombinase family protein [Candidatus Peribacteraceae bacterium]|tara:strand:+ start:6085 stop:7308 length:1224 start_codon:yes stop_codon:yes gene_type:complete
MEKTTHCLYARKSSESDERQALSIDSQIAAMQKIADKQGLKVVETIQESKSAKDSGGRKGYQSLLIGLQERRFNAILTWAPDRLSRNAGDLGKLVDLMDQQVLVQIQTSGQTFTNTPDEKFLLMILCSQAKLENDNRSKNVKRGLRTKCEMGVRPGRPPIGYKLVRADRFGDPSSIVVDEERAPYIKKLFTNIAEKGMTGREAKEKLQQEGFRNISGGTVGFSRIFNILQEPFYYGEFVYGGIRYQGNHKPIISKELFTKVQGSLKRTAKGKWGRKNFYFNQVLKCAECGSGVSGTEHTNRHGKTYVYYKCNKYGGTRVCKCKYIREEALFEEAAAIIGKIKEKHLRLNRRIKEDLAKINRFRPENDPISIEEYLIGIFREGSSLEKSNVLRNFKERLLLKEGRIML